MSYAHKPAYIGMGANGRTIEYTPEAKCQGCFSCKWGLISPCPTNTFDIHYGHNVDFVNGNWKCLDCEEK